MPEVTGVEVVKVIRIIRPDMVAILNTGFSEDIDADSAAKLGICYLQKPVRAESLIHSVA